MKTVTYTCDICRKEMNFAPDYIITTRGGNGGDALKEYEVCSQDYMNVTSFLRFNENWVNDGGVTAAAKGRGK